MGGGARRPRRSTSCPTSAGRGSPPPRSAGSSPPSRRAGSSALAVPPRLRDARLHPAPAPGRHRRATRSTSCCRSTPSSAAWRCRSRWALLRGDDRARELGPVAWPLAAVRRAGSGLSMLWTVDVRRGAIFLGAFVLPFGLLAIGFARLPWRGRWLTWLWGGLVATALAYAAVGGYQWLTRDVFWNPSVKVFNAYAPFFRVNSVFWDPSVYGRYLTVADPRLARRDPARRRSRLACRRALRRRRRDLARAAHLVLAVELRRARRRASSSRRPSPGGAGRLVALVALGAAHVRRPVRRPAGARRARREVALRRQPRHVRTGEPRRPGHPHRARPSRRRASARRLLARVPAPARHPGQGPEARRLPHDAGHRRGRAGYRRARRCSPGSSRRRSSRPCTGSAAASRHASRSRPASSSSRSPCTASSTRRSSRTR